MQTIITHNPPTDMKNYNAQRPTKRWAEQKLRELFASGEVYGSERPITVWGMETIYARTTPAEAQRGETST